MTGYTTYLSTQLQAQQLSSVPHLMRRLCVVNVLRFACAQLLEQDPQGFLPYTIVGKAKHRPN